MEMLYGKCYGKCSARSYGKCNGKCYARSYGAVRVFINRPLGGRSGGLMESVMASLIRHKTEIDIHALCAIRRCATLA